MPSRLEGIETHTGLPLDLLSSELPSTCAFPFGGNGNITYLRSEMQSLRVYMCLPVWRESKQTANGENLGFVVRIGLHVPSRLEGIETLSLAMTLTMSAYSLHVPSRLEGMETQ